MNDQESGLQLVSDSLSGLTIAVISIDCIFSGVHAVNSSIAVSLSVLLLAICLASHPKRYSVITTVTVMSNFMLALHVPATV